MKFINKVANFQSLKKLESIANDTYSKAESTIKILNSNPKAIQYGSIESIRRNMDELWDVFWILSKSSDNLEVRYLGSGGITIPLQKVLAHLIALILILEQKTNSTILSTNWQNFITYLENGK
jgi:hypothetical protein